MSGPVYNPNVPQSPSQTLNDSQPDLLQNFQSIFNIFQLNHVSLTTPTTSGNHTIVQLIELEDTPQTGPSEISVYVNKVAGQTDQIFLQFSGDGQEVQLTTYQIYSLSNSAPNTYFTFLPGNIIVYFGSFVSLPNNQLILSPSVAKNIISMSFCPIGSTASYKPRVSLQAPINEFYKAINVFSSVSFISPQPAPSCYYCVLANL